MLTIRRSAAEKIEQRIRTSMFLTRASFAGLRLSREAAAAAARNLDLVTDAYARGVVSITELLDAQNVARNSEEAATNARYDFLIDLMKLLRAAGQLDVVVDPAQRETFQKRLDNFEEERSLALR